MIGSETHYLHSAQAGKFSLRSLAMLLAATSVLLGTAQSHAGGSISSCEEYARDYADAHAGSGDPTGDMVDEGMRGAVVGGEWAGRSGARRGARAGAALSVLDNMGSTPQGWQSLYDMAYQMCINENSPANYQPDPMGSPNVTPGCSSSATTQPIPPLPDGTIRAGSGCP